MKEQSEGNSDYDIIIIECCENCQTHQNFARHSEWKYFEQFNQLKRKIQKFINNTVVIKNPVPDELIKTNEIKNEKNLFINKNTNEKIIFPRIGSFEIYIYNVLISSKLMTNQWPNHYKILQAIAKMIEDKKKGNNLEQYSVYNELQQQPPATKVLESPEKKNHRIVSRKKKAVSQLTSKAYKSIQKHSESYKEPKSTFEPIASKLVELQTPPPRKQRYINRYLQSKADNRIKLPSLNNSMSLKEESSKQKIIEQRQPSRILQKDKEKEKEKNNNTIDVLQTSQINAIPRKFSETTEGQKISLLQLRQQSYNRNYMEFTQQMESQALKFLENRSVQYSEPYDAKEIMNRSIQYEYEQGFYCDFGLQIDYEAVQKQKTYHYVQTDKIEVIDEPAPEMLSEYVQANIIIKKQEEQKEIQTIIKDFVQENVGTDSVSVVNRGFQFPQEVVRAISDAEIIDTTFQHLFEKRRNIIDNEYYSIDRFEEKSTRYKWIGRANLSENVEQLKKRIFLECIVFSVYNYFGIKTPQRRLSYQSCANVVGEKMKESALHLMTSQNPEMQHMFQFEQCNYEIEKYPISEIITFKSSKQQIKFNNYGGLLALSYFLNDYELYSSSNSQIGLVIVNQAVKQIHKLSSLHYNMHPTHKNTEDQIIVNLFNNGIKLNRLSQTVQLEFFSMLARLSDPQVFQELIKYINEIFLHMSNTYQQFRSTLLSLKLDKSYETQTVEEFTLMLSNRLAKVQQLFKGKLYTYKKYHTLSPTIKYSVPFQHKLQRRMIYKEKVVSSSDVIKHIRNKDNIVIIQGEDGLGKSTLLSQMSKQLKENDKLNIMEFSELRKEKNRIKDQLFQLTKNIIFIDNVQLYESQALNLLDRYSKGNFQVSFCVATSKTKQSDIFKSRYTNLTVVEIKLLPFDNEQIKNYLMKSLKNQSFTTKKDTIDKLVQNPRYVKILGNPFYLSLYSSFLSRNDCQKYQIVQKDLTKYMILKEHFSYCTTVHTQQMKQMNINKKQVLPNLRRIAFEYYHNNMETNEVIREILAHYEQNDLIRSQIVYYPINLESAIATSYLSLFCHQLFMNYFLIEAYSYFVEKGYRNMHMEKLFSNLLLMNLIKERYRLQETHSQLIEVVLGSKKFKNTTEASSNAITLLSKMEFVFSNMNFDDCNISEADLSNSIFYQCSFRGTDLEKAVLYKAQMISCIFDNAIMNKMNLYSKKYEIEFTAMTTSLSVDGKKIAFGCGNYLIVINAETGAEMKRIEAHLDVIRLVKYSRDGNSLITVADDKTLRIWDIYTYKSVVFKLPQKGSISYSNETETIASVNKNALKVWNLKSMANEAELEGHTEPITTVQFSYDGEWILTGSKDTTLRLWTLKGQQRVVYKGHDSQIIAGKLSPVKRTMISSSKSKDIIMWEVQSGNKILNKKFMNEITQICLDNKQKYIIANFANDNHLVILDFSTFDIIHVLSGHQAKIISISFDHNFRQLISLGKDRTARVWQFDRIMETEARNQNISKKIHKGPVLAISYDKSKRKYATSHQNGEINLWGADENNLIDQVFSHNGPVKCLAFDRTGKLYSGGSDGTLRIWNLQARRQPRNLEIYSSQMLQLKLSEKNRIIVSSSAANQLVVYDFTGIKIIMSTREQGRVNAIQFSADEKIIAVGGVEKYVVLYAVSSNNTVTRTDELGAHSDAVTSLCFFGDTLLVVALKSGQVAIWNHMKANLIKKIENLSPIKDIIAFQKKYICFTSEDGKARVVNMDEGRQIKIFRYSEQPLTIDTNEDDSLLYVGSSGGNILIWNLNCVKPTGKKIEFDRKAIDSDCTKIVTVESGKTLLIKDLFYHKQEIAEVKVDSDIQGVTFDEDRIVLLLKNGKYWEYGKKQYKFKSNSQYQGDLYYIRDKSFTNFYKSGIKKIKGMSKPALTVLQEVNS